MTINSRMQDKRIQSNVDSEEKPDSKAQDFNISILSYRLKQRNTRRLKNRPMSMSKDISEQRLDYSAFDKAISKHHLKNVTTKKTVLLRGSKQPVKEAMIDALANEL